MAQPIWRIGNEGYLQHDHPLNIDKSPRWSINRPGFYVAHRTTYSSKVHLYLFSSRSRTSVPSRIWWDCAWGSKNCGVSYRMFVQERSQNSNSPPMRTFQGNFVFILIYYTNGCIAMVMGKPKKEDVFLQCTSVRRKQRCYDSNDPHIFNWKSLLWGYYALRQPITLRLLKIEKSSYTNTSTEKTLSSSFSGGICLLWGYGETSVPARPEEKRRAKYW
jgi:hypothetical protein